MKAEDFDANKLLKCILDDCAGNLNRWWRLVEIEKNHTNLHGEVTRCSIRCGESYLRDMGHGVFIWDIHYGKDSEFNTPEQALLVMLMHAPVPPFLLSQSCWDTATAKAMPW